MRNYAGHRLAPWLGHLMVRAPRPRASLPPPSLSPARHLPPPPPFCWTPGEIMQLPPDDEIVMVAGSPPIRAKKRGISRTDGLWIAWLRRQNRSKARR